TRSATVVDLLAHRLGLVSPDWLWHPSIGSDSRQTTASHDIVGTVAHLPTVPGGFRNSFEYSNQCLALVVVVIERVSGMPYRDFLVQHLLAPLGITEYEFDADVAERRHDTARPHSLDLMKVNDDADSIAAASTRGKQHADPLELARAARVPVVRVPAFHFASPEYAAGVAGLWMSAASMQKWLGCWANDGKSITTSKQVLCELDVLTRVHNAVPYRQDAQRVHGTRTIGAACGWMVQQYGEYRVLTHNGGVDGFYANAMVVPEASLAIYAAGNSRHMWLYTGMCKLVLHALLPLHTSASSSRHYTVAGFLQALPMAKMIPYLQAQAKRRDLGDLVAARSFSSTFTAMVHDGENTKTVALPLRALAGLYHHPLSGHVMIAVERASTNPEQLELRLMRAGSSSALLHRLATTADSQQSGLVCQAYPGDLMARFVPSFAASSASRWSFWLGTDANQMIELTMIA
ncbi:beta-lactamase/transpeptidase-like protein, partial [Blastocladiella britannica]